MIKITAIKNGKGTGISLIAFIIVSYSTISWHLLVVVFKKNDVSHYKHLKLEQV